jgi:myo-inositol-1(or 4)-monophosphatase
MTWDFLATAAEAALQAGTIQRSRYGQKVEIHHKGEIDLVTEVDRACEQAILALIRERFPGHDIVTEETAIDRTGSRYVWFVDPLDGTSNFAHGYPFFCASVAVTDGGQRVAGAVYDCLKEELFTAERGVGAFLNGRRLRVSGAATLNDAMLITGFPYDLRARPSHALRLFNAFIPHARAIRRDGAAALDLCYLAAGRVDGFFEETLQPWDMMAGALMVEEAGGRISRFDGSPVGLRGDQVVAAGADLHPRMLEILAPLTE